MIYIKDEREKKEIQMILEKVIFFFTLASSKQRRQSWCSDLGSSMGIKENNLIVYGFSRQSLA